MLLVALFCQGGRKTAGVGSRETIRDEKMLALAMGASLVSFLTVSAGQVEGSKSQPDGSDSRWQESGHGELE